MKLPRTNAVCILFYFLISITCFSQPTNYPEIGKPCPDFFLNDVEHYGSKTASLNDFKGKWLILDFWSSHCLACIYSFPETNKLQKQFKDKVQFLLVGTFDNEIKQVYERFRKKYKLDLAAAFDSVMYQKFGVPSYPQVVWVSDKGIVKAITGRLEVNEKNITAFLQGRDPQLLEKIDIVKNTIADESRIPLNGAKPLLINGNGGADTDFLYRSVLTGWKKKMHYYGGRDYFSPYPANNFLLAQIDLPYLYMRAYGDTVATQPYLSVKSLQKDTVETLPQAPKTNYGQWWPKLVLELSDSSAFQADFTTGKNLYCYNLTVPPSKASKGFMQQMMRRDLQNYFGYDVKVEKRIMPCWNLVATDGAKTKLLSKGGRSLSIGNYLKGFKLQNQPVTSLILAFFATHPYDPPFIDETGISGNIDLMMPKGTFDFDDALKELHKNGLDLVKGERQVKVIVVRDGTSD